MNVQDIYFSKNEILESITEIVESGDFEAEDIIEVALDLYTDYLGEWLEQRGNVDVAEDLWTVYESNPE